MRRSAHARHFTMPRMARLRASMALAALALAAAGCSDDERPLPVGCQTGSAAFEQALRRAPARVTLKDGTRLSECVRRARSDSELQTLGFALTQLADRLSDRAAGEPVSAVRLGYLIGAARVGAAKTEGVAAELARRLEHTAAQLDGAGLAAVRRGVRAGVRTG